MKFLSSLNISENEIGDLGMIEIAKGLKETNLESLDISANAIGKTSKAIEFADTFNIFIAESKTLDEVKINWNNLRGQVGEKIVSGLKNATMLKHVSLSNNLLGV